MKPPRFFPFLAVPVFLLLVACQDKPAEPGASSLSGQSPKKSATQHLVETAPVLVTSMGLSRQRPGSLRALRTVEIFSQEEGQVTALPFYEGDLVEKGEVVALLDDSLLQAQLQRAKALRSQLEQDLNRLRALFKKQLTSADELGSKETELEVARSDENVLRTRLGYTKIQAPISGVVVRRLTEPGNVAEKQEHLLTISDPSSLITEVSVSGLLITSLSLGDEVSVAIDALGSGTYPGLISRIYPDIDPISRRGKVEVSVAPVPKGARPGQFCRVTFNARLSARMTIPFRALQHDEGVAIVYRVTGNGVAQRQTVITGGRFDDRIEILDGLSEGDSVVTRGFLDLSDGKSVKVVQLRGESENG